MSAPAFPGAAPGGLSRRHLLKGTALAAAASAVPAWAQHGPICADASDWRGFADRHIQADGRVVDFDSARQHATSEGQSYALFFALVHNDADLFARVLRWTEDALSAGSLADRLPAWQWGRRDDGTWGVVDPNPASDADLWIAYVLLEAGRLWRNKDYAALGQRVLARVARENVTDLSGLGPVMLPWPRRVASGPRWRLNPSYLPLPLLRRAALADPKGPWQAVAHSTVRMISATAPHGYAPDWCAWSSLSRAFVDDPENGPVGSYDAIRVYLWAGLTHAADPARAPLLKTLWGPRRALEQTGQLPEKVDTASGQARGKAPIGFAGAMLPYLVAQKLTGVVEAQLAQIRTIQASPAAATLPYYERMLLLFGQAGIDGRYAFDAQGRLQPQWSIAPCRPPRLSRPG